jgi:hypothetical protein
MEIEKLTGGTVIGVKPDRTEMPIYGDKARIRVGSPGTVFANVAMDAQFGICTRTELKVPETAYATVVFRQVGDKLYLIIAPAKGPGTNVYEVKYEGKSRALVIRMLKPLFEEMKITLRPDIWYDMPAKIVQDENLGMAVACVWTDAERNKRGEREKDVAAGEQPEAEGADEPDEEET